MRRVGAWCLAAALALSLGGCGAQLAAEAYRGTTVTGTVTSVDGSVVTLEVGADQAPSMGAGAGMQEPPAKLDGAEGEGGSDGATGQTAPAMPDGQGGSGEEPPAKPEGDASGAQSADGAGSSDASTGDAASQPPAKPDGAEGQGSSDAAAGQTAPAMPDGQGGSGEEPPAKPEGDASGAQSADGATSSDASTGPASPTTQDAAPADQGSQSADGSAASAPDASKGSEDAASTASSDATGAETAVFDLSGAQVQRQGDDGDEAASVSDIQEGDRLALEVDEEGLVTTATILSATGDAAGGMAPGGFGGSGAVEQGTAATTIDQDGTYADETYTSADDDQNALRVDGATVTLDQVSVKKTAGASSNTEDGDFYGMNAALLATNGAQLTINGGAVESSAQNGNGVFSYGEGTVVTVTDTLITTTKDNSGGIQTTGGGTTNAKNLTVSTAGSSSAAIRSDRGGGTVNVDGGTYTTTGLNSPAIYSTAAIAVKNAQLKATGSEALVIEGKNSIALEDCDAAGAMSEKGTSADENRHTVMIYQSMSGDAEVGSSSLSIKGGSLTGNAGDLIYVTNTHTTIDLQGVALTNHGDGVLLRVAGNSGSRGWGTAGQNGGQVDLTATDQQLAGDIVVDTASELNLTLAGSSVFEGALTIEKNDQATGDGSVSVTLQAGTTWRLTGDCTVTTLDNQGTIDFNGHTITLADGTVLS